MKKLLATLLAVGLFCTFSVSAQAEEKTVEQRLKALEDTAGTWSFYGSARFLTFYEDSSANFNDTKGITDLRTDSSAAGAAKDRKTTAWGLQNNTRLGANVKKGDLGGKVEIGFNPDQRETISTNAKYNNVYTRLLYGTYTFNDITLLVGQDYTPLSFIGFSNQVFSSDNGLYYQGVPYESYVPQIKIKWTGLQVALVENNVLSSTLLSGAPTAAAAKTKILLPRLEVRYTVKADKLLGDVFGETSIYKVQSTTGTYFDKNICSYAVGLNGGITINPVYANAVVWTAQNAKQMGFSPTNTLGAKIDATGKLTNSSDFGWAFVTGANIQKCKVEAGYGYAQSKNSAIGSQTAKARSFYLQTAIPVIAMNGAKFSITPEIGVIDNMKNAKGVSQGSAKYAGAQWRLDF